MTIWRCRKLLDSIVHGQDQTERWAVCDHYRWFSGAID